MSFTDKIKQTAEDIEGKVKEGLGKVSGDKHLESEGKTDQGKAAAEEKVTDVKDTVSGVADSLGSDSDHHA